MEIEPSILFERPNHLRPVGPRGFFGRGGRVFASNNPERRIARSRKQARPLRQAKLGVEQGSDRRHLHHPGQTAGQNRIVRQGGTNAGHESITVRSHQMHAVTDGFARDRDRTSSLPRDFAVRRNRKLERHMRPAVAHPANMPGMIAPRCCGLDTDIDSNARGAQASVPAARDFRIGVLHGRNHAGNSGSDHGVGAGRRLAMVRAWFERHVERGAARHRAGAA